MRALPKASSALACLVLAGCGSGSGAMEDRASFHEQPRAGQAGRPLEPIAVSLQDGSGQPREGTVVLEIDDNRCGARLAGVTSRGTQGGVARFEDLSIDLAGTGYRLAALAEGVRVLSTPFDVTPIPPRASLNLVSGLCVENADQLDAESLAFVPEDDQFWLADDDRPSLFSIARTTGARVNTISSSTLVEALPEAALCDDGDGNSQTSCSYFGELESLAYDEPARELYVVNTVNDPRVDKPAIFRLHKEACPPCFVFDAWRRLPLGRPYSGSIVIGGVLYLALAREVHVYDFTANRLNPSAVYVSPHRIVGLGFDGHSLWVLTPESIEKVEWATRRLRATHSIAPFAIGVPKGIEVLGDTIYVLDGNPPRQVFGLKERPS